MSGKQIITDVPAIYMWQMVFDAHNPAKGAAIATYMLLAVAVPPLALITPSDTLTPTACTPALPRWTAYWSSKCGCSSTGANFVQSWPIISSWR